MERKEKGEVKETELSGMGVDEEKGEWIPIERVTTKQAYDRLVRTRGTTNRKRHTRQCMKSRKS